MIGPRSSTCIQVWNSMRVSKWWQERNFSSKVVHACNLSDILCLCWKRSYLSLANDKECVPSGTLSDNVLSITVVSLRNEIKKERQRERITKVSFFPSGSIFTVLLHHKHPQASWRQCFSHATGCFRAATPKQELNTYSLLTMTFPSINS